MKDLLCLKTIITDNLAMYIDLTSSKSWNLNTGLTSVSLTKWSGAQSGNIFLYDFGLTAYDNGRAKKMWDTLTLTPSDNKVTLYRIGYNNATGGTFYTSLGITGVTATTGVGRHFNTNGGYLQGFFKLKGYPYEALPSRYAKGITIENLIALSGNSFNDGYFYYMGQRAEDKYHTMFSGESVQITTTEVDNIQTSTTTQLQPITVTTIDFSGVTSSAGHVLNDFIKTKTLKKAINDQNYFQSGWTQINDNGINDNVIGFFISSDRRIGFTRINTKGQVESQYSDNMLTTGWTLITIVFKPYDIITDPDVLCCSEQRLGDFIIYVNGRRFWKIENFDEYMFRSSANYSQRQIGVPYNISWGGGSFGLKYSYHYDINTRIVFTGTTPITGNSVYNTGFTWTVNPQFIGDCAVPNPIAEYTATAISGDNTTFHSIDPCSGTTGITSVLKIHNISSITGTTGTTNEYYLKYNKTLDLLSNRDYSFTFDVYDQQIFQLYQNGLIGLAFSGASGVTVVNAMPYQYSAVSTGTTFTWNKVSYKIRTTDNTGLSKVNVFFVIKSNVNLNIGFNLFIKDFKFWGSDKLSKDSRKDNGLVEQTFSKSFDGAIQKLRIYDVPLNSQEVLHNAKIEFANSAYGVNVNAGGRIIYG